MQAAYKNTHDKCRIADCGRNYVKIDLLVGCCGGGRVKYNNCQAGWDGLGQCCSVLCFLYNKNTAT